MSQPAGDEGRLAAHLRKYSPSPSGDPDAGLRALTHYERRLPRWRYWIRQRLIPIVRWETPYLSRMQKTFRSPVLDSYFAMTANLGTHTFYMMFLPLCFWCGYPDLGIALVHMLGLGVWWTGVIKDLLCLPRPLSPPLARLTMSGSAALEYGFPSTHTTNAVSVAVFCLWRMWDMQGDWHPTVFKVTTAAILCYATSITVGRVYCGMHGFFDVAVGAVIGALIGCLRVIFGPAFDTWILQGDWQNTAIVTLVILLSVRFHPEPADNCPCFDDTVSFLGVIIGGAMGFWHYGKSATSSSTRDEAFLKLYPYKNEDLLKSAARLILGIVVVFAWRAIMKPTLLRCLPPTFRFIDHWGLMIPRKYFLQAREYTQVPPLRKDDNILPSASDIPALLSNIRRRRRVSVGPQSEADAREYLANRELMRKASLTSLGEESRRPRQGSEKQPLPTPLEEGSAEAALEENEKAVSKASLQVRPAESSLLTPPASEKSEETSPNDTSVEEQKNDRRLFSLLEKPRTHYDVEVITRLVVYTGICWLAVEWNPVLFSVLGLE